VEQLVVPALSGDCPAALALRAEGLYPQVVIMDDDLAYGRLLARLWREGAGFVLVEHDVVPWPGAVAGMASCREAYCGHRYQIAGQLGGTLGCVRFSAALIAEHPDLPATWAGSHWSNLDIKLTNALWDVGVREYHVHEPPVAHLHIYPDELIRAARETT
jgi:hypothetical protein